MGPRSADRGIAPGIRIFAPHRWLQWGRDQLIAEFDEADPAVAAWAALQWGRDQLIAELFTHARAHARERTSLQWGRDQLIAELGLRVCNRGRGSASMGPRSADRGIEGPDFDRYQPDVLQWGRDQLIAELILCAPATAPSSSSGFNGAAIS